jgi:hypothetical protein
VLRNLSTVLMFNWSYSDCRWARSKSDRALGEEHQNACHLYLFWAPQFIGHAGGLREIERFSIENLVIWGRTLA